MTGSDTEMHFRKSSYSSDTANCVEVAFAGSHVAIRDSKNPDGPILTYAAQSWYEFVEALRQGEFDRSSGAS